MSQLNRVIAVMCDGKERTLRQTTRSMEQGMGEAATS